MKKLVVLVIVLLCNITYSGAQSKIPEKVTKAFEQKFKNATLVKWNKENDHEYEASFEWNGQKHSANFSDSGAWIETESSITYAQLPEKVKSTFAKDHKKALVKSIYKIENAKKEIKYEIEIKENLNTIEFIYDSNGKLIKT